MHDESGTLVDRHVRRLHPADGGRPAALHHRPRPRPRRPRNPLGRQGRRRGRHHRLDAGGRQRRRRRAAALGRRRHPDAVHPAAGVEGHPGARSSTRRSARRTPGTAATRRRRATARRCASGNERRCPVIPAAFDYVAPTTRRRGPGGARRGRRREVKVLAGGQSLLPVLRLRLDAPDAASSTSAGSPSCAASATTATRIVIGAMTTHDEVTREPAGPQHAAAAVAGGADGGRPAGPAPRHLRRLAGARGPGR